MDQIRKSRAFGETLQEHLLVSHPYVESRDYADTAKPLL